MNINDISAVEVEAIATQYRERQLERRFAEIGREKLYKDCTTVNYANSYSRGDSYDEWLEKAINVIPSWMSRDEFMELYGSSLRKEFDAYIASRAEKATEYESGE